MAWNCGKWFLALAMTKLVKIEAHLHSVARNDDAIDDEETDDSSVAVSC